VILLVAIAVVWLTLGVRGLNPESEFGVLEGALLAGRRVRLEGRWALAPPGLLRLTRYPRGGVELELPGADGACVALWFTPPASRVKV